LQKYQIKEYKEEDSENVYHFVSDMLVNEFKITLDLDNLDSDLVNIKQHYNKDDGGCFWIVECMDNSQIIGTVAIRKLKEVASADTATTIDNTATSASAELKRMFLLKRYRGLGIGQQMLDTALDFAKRIGYSRISLYSSKELKASRKLYLKNGFVDIPRYNDDYRADVFMKKEL
jgi:GNAT superfamily N-acetyltransferase